MTLAADPLIQMIRSGIDCSPITKDDEEKLHLRAKGDDEWSEKAIKSFNCNVNPNEYQDRLWIDFRKVCDEPSGIRKFFNYALLDASKLSIDQPFKRTLDRNHKDRLHKYTKEAYVEFYKAIFYIGKGSGGRPYQHLVDAYTCFYGDSREKKKLEKVKDIGKFETIHEIWVPTKPGVQPHSVIPVIFLYNSFEQESYESETAMIDVMPKNQLRNVQPGRKSKISLWKDFQKEALGHFFLSVAFNAYEREELWHKGVTFAEIKLYKEVLKAKKARKQNSDAPATDGDDDNNDEDDNEDADRDQDDSVLENGADENAMGDAMNGSSMSVGSSTVTPTKSAASSKRKLSHDEKKDVKKDKVL